jgi:tetratricopeptide (TPR) repeat protein
VLDRRAELAPEGRERVDALVRSGRLHAERLGDGAAAAERFARARELEPTDARALEGLAAARRTLGDRAGAAELLEAASEHAPRALDKARLLCEAAVLWDEHLGDETRALRLYQRAFALDPQLGAAGLRLAALLEARRRPAELEPVLAALVRHAGEGPGAADLWRRLGACARERGDADKALAAFEKARRLDPGSAAARLGLAELHLEHRRWAAARDLWREIRDHDAAAPASGDAEARARRLAVCLGLAEAEAALGETEAALAHHRDALGLDPGHVGSWRAVAKLERERGAPGVALEALQKLARLVPPHERAEVWEEIGDLHRQLGNPVEALAAYTDALVAEPQRRRTLHKRLDLEAERDSWRAALATLGELAELEATPEVRAKYLYSAAAIHREKLDEPERAWSLYERALDACWSFTRAFDAIERMLGDAQDFRGLRRAYRSMLKRIPTGSDPALEARLWQRLGELSLERFDDRDTAVLAFEAAAHIDDSDPAREERLADLYLELGPSAAAKGIAAHQRLLARTPDRVASYEALLRLYGEVDAPDKQWWAAAALVFFGDQDPKLRAIVDRRRPAQVVPAGARLGDELWALIEAPGDDRRLGELLALVAPYAAAATAPKRSALGLKRGDRIALGAEPADAARGRRRARTEAVDWFPAHALGYVSRVLGVAAPELFYRAEHFCPISTHLIEDEGAATPAVVVGQAFEQRLDDDAMIFELGRQAARLRPRLLARLVWRTPEALGAAARAILDVAGAPDTEPAGREEVEGLARVLRRALPSDVVDAAAGLVAEAGLAGVGAAELAAWADAAESAAARAAFLLTGDLAAAERALWTDPSPAAPPARTSNDRLRELVAFSVSDAHFALRAALGLDAAALEGVRQWAHG